MLKNMSNTQAVICLERRKVMIDALEAKYPWDCFADSVIGFIERVQQKCWSLYRVHSLL